MIQRIQTIYLLAAVVVGIVCLCLQIGTVNVEGLVVAREYNLWVVSANDGMTHCGVWPLFAVLTLASSVGVYAIFMFHNRVLQARFCVFCSLLIVGWYVIYVVFGQLIADSSKGEHFVPSLTAALPFVAFVLYLLARRAILADERLVRAADRIR
jgi:hypothetical protein